MGWFEQLKMIPVVKEQLGIIITNAAMTEQTVAELKALRAKPKSAKELIRSVENNQIDLQQLKDLFGQPPHGDQTLEQMKENVQKIKNAMGFLNTQDVRDLLDEGMEARKNSQPQKVKEILENLEANADLSTGTLKRYRDIRDMLDILRTTNDKSMITFEKFPSDRNLVAKFAELIGGELKDEVILVDFRSETDLINTMKINYNKKRTKILDSPDVVTKKEEIKEIYNKMQGKNRDLGISVQIGAKNVELNDLVQQKKIFVASRQKLTVSQPFSGASVIKYVRAVDKIKGSVRAFRPKTYLNGAKVSKVIFLDKSSSNSVNLNPYAEIILTSDFGENWAKTFFDTLRVKQTLTEKEAESLLIDEIYQALINNDRKTENNFDVSTFRGEGGIQDVESKPKKKVKEEIRKIISESGLLQESVYTSSLNRQREQLQFLEGNFTIKEASEFEKWYASLPKDEYPAEDLEITYLRRDRPTKYTTSKKDEQGQDIRDESGSIIAIENKGKELANYAKIELDGEQISPSDAYEFGIKVTTPKERSVPSEQLTTGKKKFEYSSGKEQQAKLEESKSKRKKLSESPLGEDSQSKRDSILTDLDKKIKNLERDVEARIRGRSSVSPENVGAEIENLRLNLLNMSDFSQYLIQTSDELKDEGGLIGIVNRIERASTAIESITPKRSLGFFAQIDDSAGSGEVRKAFKTIDSEQDLGKRKKVAEELDGKMPKIISNIKKQIIDAFELRLTQFAENPASFPDHQVIIAKKQFVDVEGILTEGE